MYLYAFNKNYIGLRSRDDSKMISFLDLFDMIKLQYSSNFKKQTAEIRKVLDWRIQSEDNILVALLGHNFDNLAVKYMGHYSHLLDKDLFIYCISHGNTIFLQKALLLGAFDKMIFREEIVI